MKRKAIKDVPEYPEESKDNHDAKQNKYKLTITKCLSQLSDEPTHEQTLYSDEIDNEFKSYKDINSESYLTYRSSMTV